MTSDAAFPATFFCVFILQAQTVIPQHPEDRPWREERRSILPGIVEGGSESATPALQEQKLPGPSTAPTTGVVNIRQESRVAPQTSTEEAGFMDPQQVSTLLHRVWLAEFRVNDLLGQVHPDRWKLPAAAEKSFNETLETLRRQLTALEEWRARYEKRPEDSYLGYETYAGINAVLPRLDGVARGVTQHENASLGAQYGQAGGQLFDLQQALEPYLSYLLRNQDQLLQAAETNLAGCQRQLSVAMQGTRKPARVIGHSPPQRPKIRRSRPRS